MNDFTEAMSKKANQDLIRITTTDRQNYNHLAVEAAEAELKTRGISLYEIDTVTNLNVNIEKHESAVKKVTAGKRFLHLVIDTITFLVISSIISYITILFPEPENKIIQVLLVYLIWAVGFFGYYIFMEYKYQKTLGKLITKTRIIKKDGTKPMLEDVVIRTVCRLIPFDAVSFLFTHNGFHDHLSETRVIPG